MTIKSWISFLIGALLVVACTTVEPDPLPPELAELHARLAAIDPLGANVRGSVIRQELLSEGVTVEDLKVIADRGNTMARLIEGFYLKHRQEFDRAGAAYLEACEAGNALACSNLATLYEWPIPREDWPAPDQDKAMVYHEMACDQGSPIGCRLLGRRLATERLGLLDLERAVSLARWSCDAGNAYGCDDLGEYYRIGRGVEKDLDQALELFRFACEADHEGACARRGRTSRELARERAG